MRPRSDGQPTHPRWLAVLLGFARIGATSFGGGSATIVAMRALTVRRGWLSEQEFLDTVVLSRLTPGITILAQAILIGRAVAGLPGLLAALFGLMTPAVVITVGLAQVYDLVTALPGAAVPLRAVSGLAAGFAVALAVQLLRDTLARSHRWRGPLLFAGYVGLAFLINNPVVVLLVGLVLGVAVPKLFAGRELAPAEAAGPDQASTPDGPDEGAR
jgi:chromate transporter